MLEYELKRHTFNGWDYFKVAIEGGQARVVAYKLQK